VKKILITALLAATPFVTLAHKTRRARRLNAKRTCYRFQCVEFSSCAASPQAQQELASPGTASPHLKTAQPDAVALSVSALSFRTGILQDPQTFEQRKNGSLAAPVLLFLPVVCLAGVIQRDFRRRPARMRGVIS